VGGVFGLNDEKPLTGSFTLSEQLEDTSQKSVDDLDVPLEGSFDVEPAKVTVSGKFVENTKPVVTMASSLNNNTPPAKPTVPPTAIYQPPKPDSNGLVSAHKQSSEPARKQNPVDLTNVIIDETRTDPIGGVFGLEDEKPLTGSFTLSEQLEDTSQKSVDDLDVPLEGSFDVEPAKVTVSGKFVENTKPVVTMADSLNKPSIDVSKLSPNPELDKEVLKLISSPTFMKEILSNPDLMNKLQNEINKNKKS
ncbi:MAG: hypothetical protein IJU14_06180, partial [Clostridia bacterium]|nr:hypothetical protein [Clostridia bacterium]